VLVLTVVAVAAAIAFFSARDDATVSRAQGPGAPRAAGAAPAVRPGNVLLQYADPALAAGLRALAEDVAGPPSPALVAAGQAVVVRRQGGLRPPVRALSATRGVDAAGPRDPTLREFVEFWVGREP
jgi:hypothetical protein